MKKLIYLFACMVALPWCKQAHAQTPTDGIMMNKGEICFALLYEHGTWDQYWEGDLLRTNGNVGTLTRTTILPMFAFGIIDRLNLIAGLPYISTESDGGQMTGVDGFQDISIALKGDVLEKQVGKGKFNLLATGEFSTPVTNYLPDYAPYSLGLGTDQYTLRGILQYKFDMGLYVRAATAHLWRTYARCERDYYYNEGSYYSEWMDVPNAWHHQFVSGIWLFDESLKIEANYTLLRCVNGDDIRAWNPGQPTNKVEVDQLAANVQYFIPQVPGFGVMAYYSTFLEGRNMGKFTNFGGGLTYQFKIF